MWFGENLEFYAIEVFLLFFLPVKSKNLKFIHFTFHTFTNRPTFNSRSPGFSIFYFNISRSDRTRSLIGSGRFTIKIRIGWPDFVSKNKSNRFSQRRSFNTLESRSNFWTYHIGALLRFELLLYFDFYLFNLFQVPVQYQIFTIPYPIHILLIPWIRQHIRSSCRKYYQEELLIIFIYKL